MRGAESFTPSSFPVLFSLNDSAHGGVCQEGIQTGILPWKLEIGWEADPVGQQDEGFGLISPVRLCGAPQSLYCDHLVVRYPETSTSFVFLGKSKPGSQPLEGWG